VKKTYIFLFIFTLHFTLHTLHYLYGQVEVGVGLTPGLTSSKEEKTVEKSRDLFISELAEKFAYEEKDLQRLYRRGYGYTELIKLILISQKSAKPLTEVVKKRDKGKKLRIIAKDYEIDYSTIMEEAKQIREEINNSLLSGLTTLPLLPGTTEIENLH